MAQSASQISAEIGKNFGIHVLLGAVGVGALMLKATDQSILDVGFLSSIQNTAPEQIPVFISDARSAAMVWWMEVVALSFVLSSLWLVLAGRRTPPGPEARRALLPGWCGMAIGVAAAAGLLAWWSFKVGGAHLNLAGAFATEVVTGGLLGALVTFYLGTAIGVQVPMRPSVPAARLWLR